ncbi:hypothetical protein T12_9696 [Trichinella patagoniensis]|uniref:Uncharacterized protein n=1 Tax=Trichinella patagoniensis TaxID=990121 RepID=A0A0V0Z682_9BILA|nr:hypothetical protein T12_9696 [Trichinella patagoniensis]
MDAYWTYVLSRLTFQLTLSKFHSIKQSTEEYNRTLGADEALISMEKSTDFVRTPDGFCGPLLRVLYAIERVTRCAVTYDSVVTLISSLSPGNLISLNYCENR